MHSTRERGHLGLASEYREAKHVRVQVLERMRDPIDVGLAKRRLARDVALTVPHFSLARGRCCTPATSPPLSERLAARYVEYLEAA